MSDCKTIFIKPRDAAKILNVTYQTIYEMVRYGTIKAIKVGGSWRINKKEFMEQFGITEEAFGEQTMCVHCETVVEEQYIGSDGPFVFYESVKEENFGYSRIVKCKDDIWIETENWFDDTVSSANISYCPWCGRKLVD